MLLFFIAQMTAWADSCKAENLNTQEIILYEKEVRMKQLERQLKREIELDNSSSLGLRLYKGLIDLFEAYPKTVGALSLIMTPLFIFKISKFFLGDNVKKIKTPPNKNVVPTMKLYLKKFS